MKKQAFLWMAAIFLSAMPLQLAAQSLNSGLEPRSISQARRIAITNTLLPIATGVASVIAFDNNTVQTVGAVTAIYGLLMGPSTGNFYAEDYTRGIAGLAIRAAGVYLMADATSKVFGREFADALGIDDQNVSLTDTKVLGGEILILGSVLYNILSAKASVNEYNAGKGFRVNVAPAVIGGKFAPALTAKVNF